MAKKGSKSQAIRDLLTANPKMKIAQVVEELKGKGITVNKNLAYLVKSKMKAKRRRQVKRRVAKVMSSNRDPVATILKVKALAHEVGGLSQLKALVEALGE